MYHLSLWYSGVIWRKDSTDEGAIEPSLRSKWAALQPQSVVWVRPATGMHFRLRARSLCPDCWRLELGGQRELYQSPENLRGYYLCTEVLSALCGGPPGGCQQPCQKVLEICLFCAARVVINPFHEYFTVCPNIFWNCIIATKVKEMTS